MALVYRYINFFIGCCFSYKRDWLHSFRILSLFTLLGIVVIIYILTVAGGRELAVIKQLIVTEFAQLRDTLRKTEKNFSNSSKLSPQKEKELDVKPTGSGAFAGMLIGGAIGLAGSPLGVITCGIIRAIIGAL